MEEGGLEGRTKGKGDVGGRRWPRRKEKSVFWWWRKEEMLRKGCDSKAEAWSFFAWAYFWYRHDTFF